MKRFVSLTIMMSILLSLAAGAHAAGFSDVPAGSWFEGGVALCAEKGIMIGTGESTFSPDKELTDAECLTLALRLYDLQRGGSGTLENAPDDWDAQQDGWWRDALYTAKAWGLLDDMGFATLYNRLRIVGPQVTKRETFAHALASAAGALEKRFSVEKIPGILDSEYEINPDLVAQITGLYEAGILNGVDEYGTFGGDQPLTRAQAAVMAARVLDEAQRLTEPPKPAGGYAMKTADLRARFGYHNETLFDTDLCTVFLYDLGGFMRAPTGLIEIFYKPGSGLGDGTVVTPPLKSSSQAYTSTAPDFASLSEDGTAFVYTYRFYDEMDYPGENTEDFSYDFWRHQPGTYTYTVDLATGEVAEDYAPAPPITPELLWEDNDNFFTVEKVLSAPACRVVLYHTMQGFPEGGGTLYRVSYKLRLLYPDGSVKGLLLPSTELWRDDFHPTGQAPDSVELSEDGSALTYVYTFEKPLLDEAGTILHEAGAYTYTADLATGELACIHTPR